MVVDSDQAEPLEEGEEPNTWKQRLRYYFERMLPMK